MWCKCLENICSDEAAKIIHGSCAIRALRMIPYDALVR